MSFPFESLVKDCLLHADLTRWRSVGVASAIKITECLEKFSVLKKSFIETVILIAGARGEAH